jgi:hypothetical protein
MGSLMGCGGPEYTTQTSANGPDTVSPLHLPHNRSPEWIWLLPTDVRHLLANIESTLRPTPDLPFRSFLHRYCRKGLFVSSLHQQPTRHGCS